MPAFSRPTTFSTENLHHLHPSQHVHLHFACDFDRLTPIGEGAFGKVYTVMRYGNRVAVKRAKPFCEHFIRREAEILSHLAHPNVVKSWAIDEKLIFFQMEYIPRTLHSEMYSQRASLPMDQIQSYMKQLLEGLAYIHDTGFVHHDIKPDNLLVIPSQGILKIADFSGACSLAESKHHVLPVQLGTLPYRPPELATRRAISFVKVDVWAAGCVFAEMLRPSGPLFYVQAGNDDALNDVILETFGLSSHLEKHYSDIHNPWDWPETTVRDFVMSAMYQRKFRSLLDMAAYRISIKEALNTPYFTAAISRFPPGSREKACISEHFVRDWQPGAGQETGGADGVD